MARLIEIYQAFDSHVFFFILAILITGILTWIIRSFAESDPDPFFLNLTFFAFAGECIRAIELFSENNVKGSVGFLMLLEGLIVMFQLWILKQQKTATLEHYKELLSKNKTADCSEHEIDHWANSLLRVSGIDFHPGYYRWLAGFALNDPRARSRREALEILPNNRFKICDLALTAESLIVPDKPRNTLWHCYWITCLGSWIFFIITVIVSRKKL